VSEWRLLFCLLDGDGVERMGKIESDETMGLVGGLAPNFLLLVAEGRVILWVIYCMNPCFFLLKCSGPRVEVAAEIAKITGSMAGCRENIKHVSLHLNCL